MLTLVIGNKRYSSWSLRPWLLMTEAGIPFREVRVALYVPGAADTIRRYTPAGRVPVLVDDALGDAAGGLAIWDSLAIVEYLAERFPERGCWPDDVALRARARAVVAEMHAGFATLRQALPMNAGTDLAGHGWSVAVQDDVDRIAALWRDALGRSGGPFLFGRFGIADAFFAPVVSRFATYAVPLADDAAAYRDRVLATAGLRRWIDDARGEGEFIAGAEPYRRAPTA